MLCNESFPDTSKVSEHLADQHLANKGEPSKNTQTLKCPSETASVSKRNQKKETTLETLFQFRRKSESLPKETVEVSDVKMKDENAVNREIAALLLNLHASRGAPKIVPQVVPKPEDSGLNNESAMDLTKSKTTTTLNMPLPATITRMVKSHSGVDLSGKMNNVTNPVPNNLQTIQSQNLQNFSLPNTPTSYPFYSSLATMAGMSPTLAMNSNYLLQNLLLGKMQQIVSASSSSVPTPSIITTKTSSSGIATLSVPTTSLPTQPLPAQSLAMPSSNVTLKPPPAVFKTTSVPHSSTGGLAPNFTNPMTLTSGVGNETTTTTVTAATTASIPLLCGQIVSQLNGLLFLVHGINSPAMEMNLQTQLTAIHTRLQDIVAMVEHAKKSDPELNGDSQRNTQSTNVKQKEEEKIVAKHIQDYQRALLKQQEDKSNLVVDFPEASSNDSMELQEAESTSGYLSAAARRRRGRPPKNSNLDLSYSPPEKQMRSSSGNAERVMANSESGPQKGDFHGKVNGNSSSNLQQQHHQQQQQPQNGVNSNNANESMNHAGAGKSGKGIRNRVFCGECGGCLKNDDCGKCRYCKDKTKFGGQNRLRQKCLHRRCQVSFLLIF